MNHDPDPAGSTPSSKPSNSAKPAPHTDNAHQANRTRNRRKLMWQIPFLVLMVAVVFWTFGALFGRHILYHPTRLTEDDLLRLVEHASGWALDVTEVHVDDPTREPLEAVGLVRFAQGADRPWVLYFGGNAQSLQSSHSLLELLLHDTPWGAAVWAYRGYDMTPGTPNERDLVADGVAVARSLISRHELQPTQLLIVGQSLGSGVATQVARRLTEDGAAPGGLVLVSPFRSIPAVGNDKFLWPLGHVMPDTFRNDKHVLATTSPVLILHGTSDRVIPYSHGTALHESLGTRSTLHTLDGAGHNDIWNHGGAVDAFRSFVEEHATR